jgi:tetratricopeptide (TPR) repeat protein
MTSLSDEDIRAALLRISASEPFRNAPQLVSFLNFIVEKTLVGQKHAIKGYTIATQALSRPADFDPQADPIVRVEAGRLRRALSTYYAGAGREDPVRIVVPRGTYVPQFVETAPDGPAPDGSSPDPLVEPGPAPAEPPAADPPAPEVPAPVRAGDASWVEQHRNWIVAGIVLVVTLVLGALVSLLLNRAASNWLVESLHLRQVGTASSDDTEGRPVIGVGRLELNGAVQDGFSPDLMRSMIIDGLARFDHFVVIDLANGRKIPEREHYVLNLRLTTNARAGSVVSRLTHEPSGKVIWTRSFDPAAHSDPSLSRESSISRQIVPAIAQPSGALFSDLRTRPTLSSGMRCTLQAYDYWSNPTVEAHARVRDCLEAIVAAQPNAAKALAYLARVYLDEYRVGFNARPNPLDRAVQAARRAMEIAPESPRTNQALMAALFVLGETEQALSLGRRALDLNPLDTDIVAEMGARLIQVGQYGEGQALITRAASLNPADPPWYNFFLFLAAYMQEDIRAARAAAAQIRAPDYVLGLIAKSAIAVHDREPQKGRELVARIVAIQPEFGVDPAAALARRNFAPEIQTRLLDALRRAGLRT